MKEIYYKKFFFACYSANNTATKRSLLVTARTMWLQKVLCLLQYKQSGYKTWLQFVTVGVAALVIFIIIFFSETVIEFSLPSATLWSKTSLKLLKRYFQIYIYISQKKHIALSFPSK